MSSVDKVLRSLRSAINKLESVEQKEENRSRDAEEKAKQYESVSVEAAGEAQRASRVRSRLEELIS